MKLGCTLLLLTFVTVLLYPPAAAVVVPLFSLIWLLYWLSAQRRS